MKDLLLDFFHWVGRVRSRVRLQQVELDTGTFSYLERQGARETIVLLHGFAASKYVWLRFIRRLPRRYRVLSFDLAGHGDNPADTGQFYSIDHYVNVLHTALQKLGIHRFHLAGNSLGGLIATHYTLNFPEEVITLGLFAPAGVFPPVASDFQKLLEQDENPLIVGSQAEFKNLMDYIFTKTPLSIRLMHSAMASRLVQRATFNQQLWSNLEQSFEDISHRLSEIETQCFLLWGDQDRVLHVSSVQIYQQHLQNVKTIIAKNTGHVPMVENSRQVARLYLWFFRQTGHLKS